MNATAARENSCLESVDAVDDDWLLIQKCREGDNRAFDSLMRRHYTLVYNLCYRFVLNPDLAAEAAQESFFSLYKSREKLVDRGIPLVHLMCRIAANTSRNMYHRCKLERGIFSPLWEDSTSNESTGQLSPYKELVQKEAMERVSRGLTSLKIDERIVFVLAEVGGFSSNEIAVMQKIPAYTVRRRVESARSKLASFMRKELVADETE